LAGWRALGGLRVQERRFFTPPFSTATPLSPICFLVRNERVEDSLVERRDSCGDFGDAESVELEDEDATTATSRIISARSC